MLSHHERRWLEEIERRLEHEDPAFVKRMRRMAYGRRRYWWALVGVYLAAWAVVPALAGIAGSRPAALYAAMLAGAAVLCYCAFLFQFFYRHVP